MKARLLKNETTSAATVESLQTKPSLLPSRRHRARQVINRAACDADGFGLLGDTQLVITGNHRLAVSNPALLSAPSKSFSKVNPPIWACSAFTSIGGAAAAVPVPGPNTLAAPSCNCSFHAVIWLTCTPN